MVDYQLLSIKNMFQNIKVISTGDKTTKTNKPYKSLVVQDESNAEFKVNIWSDFPDFANVKEGSVIRGKLEQNGQYWNLVSETQAKPRGGGYTAHKEAVIEKAVERKEGFIAKSQDNKEWGIKVASTMNKAIDLAIAEYTKNPNSLFNLDECIKKWRKYLWNNWNVDIKDTDPTTDEII